MEDLAFSGSLRAQSSIIFDEIKNYIGDVLDTYSISFEHVIQLIDSTDKYTIIQISPSKFLYDNAFNTENNKLEFNSYIGQIINSVLIKYNLTVDNLDIQFNDSFIWIVYSLQNIYEVELFLSLLPEEILQETFLDSHYDDIKRLCATSKEFALLCKSDRFWRAKFKHDFGFNPQVTRLNPKSLEEIYLNQGKIWVFGYNKYGQLGLGDNIDRNIPTKIPNIYAKSVSCGTDHTVIIDINNEVWSFGKNEYGQLGLRDNIDRNIPTKIAGIFAKSVSCGFSHTILININNEVWSFGENKNGQLGLGHNRNINTPTKISGIFAKSVTCNRYKSFLIDINNDIFAFGLNGFGRLGLRSGDGMDRSIPTKIDGSLSFLSAKQISSGTTHLVIIDMNNEVWSFINNHYGQLGLRDNIYRNIPTKISNMYAKSVYCGKYHTVIIDMNNEVWSFGHNRNGQLGVGHNRSINIPTKINSTNTFSTARSVSCGGNSTVIIGGI